LFPLQLVSDYSFNQIPITGWINPFVWLSFLIYAGMIVYSVIYLKKRSVLVFGILVYLITFSIYSNIFIIIGSSFGERFLYLPSLGFTIMLAWLVLKIFRVPMDENVVLSPGALFKKFKLLWLVAGVILLLYSLRTVTRNSEWESQWTLFSADIKRSPNSAHLHYYWGLTIRDEAKEQKNPQDYQSMMRDAVKEFETGISIYANFAECYHQLGLAWFRLGDNEKALEKYNKAVSLTPNEAVLYSNMGIIYYQRKDYQKAVELYQKAISIDPHYADAHMNLGSMYGLLGDFEKSLFYLKKSLEYDPNNASAYYYLGLTYRNLNKTEEADRHFKEATRLNPALKKPE